MATFYIVEKDKSPLGPNEIPAGGTIIPGEGDTYVFTSKANSNTVFEPTSETNFDVQFLESNANTFTAEFKGFSNPNITIADNVELSDLAIKAPNAQSVDIVIGDNVTLHQYDGSTGVDNVVIGDNFTTYNHFKTDDGDDNTEVGRNANAPSFDGGNGNDSYRSYSSETTASNMESIEYPDGEVNGTVGHDFMGPGYRDANSDEIDGRDGTANTIVGSVGSDTIDAGDGNDIVYGDYKYQISDAPAPTSSSEKLVFDIKDADAGSGTVSVDISNFGTPTAENDVTITDSAEGSRIDVLALSKVGQNDGHSDVFRIDLTTFDDDFTITIKSEDASDKIYLSGVIDYTNNNDGTFDYIFIGDDGLEHIVTVNPGLATVEHFTSPPPAGTVNEDSIFGGAGDDYIDAGFGRDVVDAGDGNDTISISEGADTIDGGAGTDTYEARFGTSIVDETISVTVNEFGNGTVAKANDGSIDSISSIESFFAGETAGEIDKITLSGSFKPIEISDISDAAVGIFEHDIHGKISFGRAGDPTFNELLSGSYVHPTYGPISPFGTVRISSGDESGQIGNTSYSNFETVNFNVVCYAPSTMIDTPDGPVPVEDLQPGDFVQTIDHGPQPLRWTRSADHAIDGARGDDCPVLIAAGALGAGLPARDLVVSPQHRILVGAQNQLEDIFLEDTLVPAKALCGLVGIRRMRGKTKITWIHFALDRHELVLAFGCISESLLLGPMVVNGLTKTEQAELKQLFGASSGADRSFNGAPARPLMGAGVAERMISDAFRICA